MELAGSTLLLSITLERKCRSCSRGICSLAGLGCWRSHRALTLHCLTDVSSLFSTFHHQWLILIQATQVRSYLWMAESQICLGRGKLKKSCSRSALLNTPALEKIQSRVLCFGSRWSALWVDLWVEETCCEVVCELLYIWGFSMASALCVGPWTFLGLFSSCNALHIRSALIHWHPAAVLVHYVAQGPLNRG